MSLWKAISAYYDSSNVVAVRCDQITSTLQTITYAHHEIHSGSAFFSTAEDTSMADSETLALAFKTANTTERAHMLIAWSTKAGGLIELLEGPTWTTSTGSQEPIYNRKRLTSMHSSMLLEDTAGSFSATDNLVLNPTALAGGTAIWEERAWSATGQAQASAGRDVAEWVLKPDTQYAVRFTAAGGTNAGAIALHWYEHTDHN